MSSLCSHLPLPASPGCSGRPSRVVRGQSHAGKLDWRMQRLLLRFQTQGEYQLPFVFNHNSFFRSLKCFSVAPPLPSLLFFISLSRALIACFYFRFCDASVYLCIPIKSHVPKHEKIFTLAVCIQRIHPTSAGGNLPKQMMSD